MIARILLPERPDFSVPAFTSQLQEFVSEGRVGAARKVGGKIAVAIDQSTVQLGMSSKPVTWVWDQVAKSSAHWSIDADSVSTHQAQLMFRITGTDTPVQQAKWLTVVVLTALQQCPGAVAVYWESAGQCIPAVAFAAAASDPNDWPSIWVSVSCQGKWQGAVGCTRGMAAFGQREIETRNATESPEELFGRLYGLINYLLQNGPIIKDRETFGQTADEKITVVYSDESAFGNPGAVMNLDYSGARVIAPEEKLAVPEKVSVPSFGSAKPRKRGKRSPVPVFIGMGVVAFLLLCGMVWLVSSFFGGLEGQPAADGGKLMEIVRSGEDAVTRLRAAEKLVGSGEQLFFGNTNNAADLASYFNRTFNRDLQALVNQQKVDANLGAEWTETYCEIRGDSAAILCNVPGFAAAGADSQRELRAIAWESAYQHALDRNLKDLALAIRDGDSCCSVQSGSVQQSFQDGNAMVYGGTKPPEQTGTDGQVLVSYFKIGPSSSRSTSGTRTDADIARERARQRANDRLARNDPAKDAGAAKGNRNTRRPPRNTTINKNSLQYRWDGGGEEIFYRGELASETSRGNLETDFDLTVRAGNFDALRTSGSLSTLVLNPQRSGINLTETLLFEGSQEIESHGEVTTYTGNGYLPLMSQPVMLLPFVELPRDNTTRDWTIEREVEVRTIEYPREFSPETLVETQIRYKPFESPRQHFEGRGFGGGMGGVFESGPPDPGMMGIPDHGGVPQRPERLLHTSDCLETCRYWLGATTGNRVTINCEYKLVNEKNEKSGHEITYNGKYVFDRVVGLIVNMDVKGRVSHKNSDINLEAPFSLSLRRSTRKDEERLAAERDARSKEREARDKRREKQREEETRQREMEEEAEALAEAERWLPEKIVERLASTDEDVVRDVLSDLSYRAKIQPPQPEIGQAIIKLLIDNPTGASISTTVVKKWVTADLGPQLLEVLPGLESTHMFSVCSDILKDYETPGLPECLIACLEVETLRSFASLKLNRYESEIETLFHDLLDKSEDEDALRRAIMWMISNGTRKSLSRLKRLSKRTESKSIQRLAESAVRFIERKKRR